MKYLHDNKFVHLDIKPENVMCVNLEKKWVKLVDFGSARKIGTGGLIEETRHKWVNNIYETQVG